MPRAPRAVRIVGAVADVAGARACAGALTPAAVDAAGAHALDRDSVVLDGELWSTRRREREVAAAVVAAFAAAARERHLRLTAGDVWDRMGDGGTPGGSQPSQCAVWERAPAACQLSECVGSLDGLGTAGGL
eukprot:gene5986-55_t